TFYHLLDDIGRLARLGGARGGDRSLLVDDARRHLLARYRDWLRRRDVHRQILAERLVAAGVIDDDADLRAVHVRRDPSLRLDAHEPAQRNVLADLLDERNAPRIDGLARGERAARERVDVGHGL